MSSSVDHLHEGYDDEVELHDWLVGHLQYNHYPPVTTALVPACIEAIRKMQAGEPGAPICLPENASRRGKRFVVAEQLYIDLHLDDWNNFR